MARIPHDHCRNVFQADLKPAVVYNVDGEIDYVVPNFSVIHPRLSRCRFTVIQDYGWPQIVEARDTLKSSVANYHFSSPMTTAKFRLFGDGSAPTLHVYDMQHPISDNDDDESGKAPQHSSNACGSTKEGHEQRVAGEHNNGPSQHDDDAGDGSSSGDDELELRSNVWGRQNKKPIRRHAGDMHFSGTTPFIQLLEEPERNRL
eukprot:m.218177 g.218177  ORF g.218177 m.218177 type:complete len:203 (+) comp39890_c1_seq10:282-890(+)